MDFPCGSPIDLRILLILSPVWDLTEYFPEQKSISAEEEVVSDDEQVVCQTQLDDAARILNVSPRVRSHFLPKHHPFLPPRTLFQGPLFSFQKLLIFTLRTALITREC